MPLNVIKVWPSGVKQSYRVKFDPNNVVDDLCQKVMETETFRGPRSAVYAYSVKDDEEEMIDNEESLMKLRKEYGMNPVFVKIPAGMFVSDL